MSATYATKTTLPLGTRPNINKLSLLRSPLGTVTVARRGGSETYGYGVWQSSYGYDLYNLLTTRGGITPSFVGCYTNASADSHVQSSHAQIGISPVQYLSGGLYDMGTAPRSLATYLPDLLIEDTVVNAANDDALTASWLTDVSAYFDYAHSLSPATRFVIMTGFEAADAARRARIATINALMPDLQAHLDGAGILYVMAEARIIARDTDQDPAEAIGSRVHWNARGGLKIADCLFPAVMNALGLDAVW